MAKYKAILYYSSGNVDDDGELFDTEAEAAAHGAYMCACVEEGAETLEMSNPGDYPLENAVSAEYEVVEVDE